MKNENTRKVRNKNTQEVKSETPEKGEKRKTLRSCPEKKKEFLSFNTKKIKKLALITLYKKVPFPEI